MKVPKWLIVIDIVFCILNAIWVVLDIWLLTSGWGSIQTIMNLPLNLIGAIVTGVVVYDALRN